MIKEENKCFTLNTLHTSYLFHVLPSGHLEHLHYGKKIYFDELAIEQKNAFSTGHTIAYEQSHPEFTLENTALEMSSYGKGDFREPFVELEYPDGNTVCDFLYDHYIIDENKEENELPSSYGTNEHLCITLKERDSDIFLELHYYIYEDCDVITRQSKLINRSENTIKIKRLMSYQLDLLKTEYILTTFNGAWTREMKRNDIPLLAGKHINSSVTGTSSHHANPFIMISRKDTSEEYGDCYGMNLIYSGNHYECADVSVLGKTRIVGGISPAAFTWNLEPDKEFLSAEGVMTYSHKGFTGMSHHMHTFIQEHIVRGYWKHKERPVLLNSWEAFYFNINEKNLLNLAKDAKHLGIELLVLDDGWYGHRDSDNSSLGDWYVYKKKFPNGLSSIAKKIHDMDMLFGIWVEPEMISEDSDLYREHPEWAIRHPSRHHSTGRSQMILDLSNIDVQDYIIEAMSKVFKEGSIDYVKWDMNRNYSDLYSQSLDTNHMSEFSHRTVLGLYRIMKTLTERFPEILFEGCSSGGNRFDLGILCTFPQIWASDDTDALCRSEMQYNYTYGYPLSVIGSHVSSVPNHQTLRRIGLDSRFNIASLGLLGYECNIHDASKQDLDKIRDQIALYKQYRKVIQFGTFYRTRIYETGYTGVLENTSGNIMQCNIVNDDQSISVGVLFQKLVIPTNQNEVFFARGLDEDTLYHFYNKKLKYNILEFGDLVNTVSPVHIKQDSAVHRVLAKHVQLDGEVEDYKVHGSTLMYHGIALKQAFAAQGYNEDTRHFPDFASRFYIMEKDD